MLKVAYMMIGLVNFDPNAKDDTWIMGPFEYPSFDACVEAAQKVTPDTFTLGDKEFTVQVSCDGYKPDKRLG